MALFFPISSVFTFSFIISLLMFDKSSKYSSFVRVLSTGLSPRCSAIVAKAWGWYPRFFNCARNGSLMSPHPLNSLFSILSFVFDADISRSVKLYRPKKYEIGGVLSMALNIISCLFALS